MYYVKCEVDKINGAIKNHHFDDIAYHSNFVFIIVYIDSSCATKFKLVYSNNFDKNMKKTQCQQGTAFFFISQQAAYQYPAADEKTIQCK